jgi:hypothetical protein
MIDCTYLGCNKSFTTRSHLNRHIQSEHEVKRFECPTCHIKFTRKEKLKKHTAEFHKGKQYVCSYPGCNKPFKQESDLQKHIPKHSTIHFCADCGDSFLEIKGLQDHIKNMHIKKPRVCKYLNCGETFTSDYKLNHHIGKHSDIFRCTHPVCNKNFYTQNDLNKHIEDPRSHNKRSTTCKRKREDNSIQEFHVVGNLDLLEGKDFANTFSNEVHNEQDDVSLHGSQLGDDEVHNEQDDISLHGSHFGDDELQFGDDELQFGDDNSLDGEQIYNLQIDNLLQPAQIPHSNHEKGGTRKQKKRRKSKKSRKFRYI